MSYAGAKSVAVSVVGEGSEKRECLNKSQAARLCGMVSYR